MKVQVTQLDIYEGVRHCPRSCPVARALMRASSSTEVEVNGVDVSIDGLEIMLPEDVQRWISRFDDHREVSPFEFELSGVSRGDESRAQRGNPLPG